jgi:hypothetical protein
MSEKIEVKYTGGMGAAFYGAIPGLLAGAALMWLAFYVGIIDWRKTQRIEARMDGRVGVHGELTTPVDLIIRKTGCFGVSRAFLDGGELTVYMTNGCHVDKQFFKLHWNAMAPDGTVIDSGYENNINGNSAIGADDTLEFKAIEVAHDSRVAKIVVYANAD